MTSAMRDDFVNGLLRRDESGLDRKKDVVDRLNLIRLRSVAVYQGGEGAAACSAVKATRFAGAANKFAATLTASARCRFWPP